VSASGRSSGKTIITVVLVIIAVLAIVAGIIYFIEPAHSLPSIMGKITHPPASLGRANASRSLRGAGALVVGVISSSPRSSSTAATREPKTAAGTRWTPPAATDRAGPPRPAAHQ